MRGNPLNIAVALATAATLALGLSGCGSHPSPANKSYPDCDLGDLREGDTDCKDPRALRDAIHRYGQKRVDDARREYQEKLAKKLTPKASPSKHH